MRIAAELEPRSGRPYNVRSGRHFRKNDDGTVSYAIVRREESGAPSGAIYYFTGADEAAALACFEQWCDQRYEVVRRQSERRSKWGPLGAGKMS